MKLTNKKIDEILNQLRALESNLDNIDISDKEFNKLMKKIIFINNLLQKIKKLEEKEK
jgi:prefoldin subunit 5